MREMPTEAPASPQRLWTSHSPRPLWKAVGTPDPVSLARARDARRRFFPLKLADDRWAFNLQFAAAFMPRLTSVVALRPNNERIDLQASTTLVRHTERYCVIVAKGLPIPCTVRVMATGAAA